MHSLIRQLKHLIQVELGLVWWAHEEEEEEVREKGLTGALATLLMYPELQAALPTPQSTRPSESEDENDKPIFPVCLVTSKALSGNCLSYSHEIKLFSNLTWSWVSTCSHTDLPICTDKPAVMTLMINTMCNPLPYMQSFSLKQTPTLPWWGYC